VPIGMPTNRNETNQIKMPVTSEIKVHVHVNAFRKSDGIE
jgi:hypothetical protein